MNLPDDLIPAVWYWLGYLFFAPLLIRACLRAPWQRLAEPHRLHAFLGSCVFLMLLWRMDAGIMPGLNLHLIGATTLTLMFGPELAVIGLALVLGTATLSGEAGWMALGLNGLTMAVVPVTVSQTVFRLVERRLPQNFFVYIFVSAFGGAAVAMLATGLAINLLVLVSGAYDLSYLAAEYLPFFMLLGWSEALLTGMMLTLFVVYLPTWVTTFDDRRYLSDNQ